MNKHLKMLILICLCIFLMLGCNIFDFSDEEGITTVEKSEENIRKGNYIKAKLELAEAIEDSVDSQVIYLMAKATLLDGGFDIGRIISLIKIQDPIPGLKLAILELLDELRDIEKTKWFNSNIEVAVLLSRIWREETTGIFSKSDISIDYAIATMMIGILKIRDPNCDFNIDFNDFQLDMVFFQKAAGFTKSGFKVDGAKIQDISGNIIVDERGSPIILKGLTAFIGDWDSLAPGVGANYKPDDINIWLNNTLKSMNNTDSIISEDLKYKDKTTFNINEMKQYNRQVGGSFNNFWYNDGVDNDGDLQIDEEEINGIDDDKDGLVDEDTTYHPRDPTPAKNTHYLSLWEKWVLKTQETIR